MIIFYSRGVYFSFRPPPPGEGGGKNMSFQWVWGEKMKKKGKLGKETGKEKREGERKGKREEKRGTFLTYLEYTPLILQ